MRRLLGYLRRLSTGRVILWCYLIWYILNVAIHFDPRPRLWLTSVGLSVVIGTALLLSTRASSTGVTHLDRWQVFRLYLMPFCVSSFAALVKDAGYILVFPPSVKHNVAGILLIATFVLLVRAVKLTAPPENASAPAKPIPTRT